MRLVAKRQAALAIWYCDRLQAVMLVYRCSVGLYCFSLLAHLLVYKQTAALSRRLKAGPISILRLGTCYEKPTAQGWARRLNSWRLVGPGHGGLSGPDTAAPQLRTFSDIDLAYRGRTLTSLVGGGAAAARSCAGTGAAAAGGGAQGPGEGRIVDEVTAGQKLR